jgi:integrase
LHILSGRVTLTFVVGKWAFNHGLLAKSLAIPVSRKNNGLVIHSLRHSFETQAVDSGVPQFVVDQWMGHRGDALMGSTYYGHSDEKSVNYMKKIAF